MGLLKWGLACRVRCLGCSSSFQWGSSRCKCSNRSATSPLQLMLLTRSHLPGAMQICSQHDAGYGLSMKGMQRQIARTAITKSQSQDPLGLPEQPTASSLASGGLHLCWMLVPSQQKHARRPHLAHRHRSAELSTQQYLPCIKGSSAAPSMVC